MAVILTTLFCMDVKPTGDMENKSSSSITGLRSIPNIRWQDKIPDTGVLERAGSRASSPPCVRYKSAGQVMCLEWLTHESPSSFSTVNYITAEGK